MCPLAARPASCCRDAPAEDAPLAAVPSGEGPLGSQEVAGPCDPFAAAVEATDAAEMVAAAGKALAWAESQEEEILLLLVMDVAEIKITHQG